jgi:hypothetical protein
MDSARVLADRAVPEALAVRVVDLVAMADLVSVAVQVVAQGEARADQAVAAALAVAPADQAVLVEGLTGREGEEDPGRVGARAAVPALATAARTAATGSTARFP